MKTFLAMAVWICAFCSFAVAQATPAATNPTAQLGSADFMPTPDHPIGWRGDGSGVFPGATPPAQWSVIGQTLCRDLRCSAKKPAADTDGIAIPDGIIKQWLVAGPFPADPSTLDQELIPNESTLQPDDGDKAGDASWKAVAQEKGVDFTKVFDKKPNQVAYAHTYVFSKDGGEAVSWVRHVHFMRMVVNGKTVYDAAASKRGVRSLNGGWPSRVQFQLNKGWNSLLFKVNIADEPQWGFVARIWPGGKYDDASANIAWTTMLPWTSTSSPIVVGDKVFTTGERSLVICLNKRDGKVLWLRSDTFLDTLTPAEKTATPDFAAKGDPLLAQLRQKDADLAAAINAHDPKLSALQNTQEDLQKQINSLASLAGKKYDVLRQDGGYSCATLSSDGKSIYAWHYTGQAAAIDLDGKLQWSRHLEIHESWEHGFGGSPVLVDGRLVTLLYTEFTAFDALSGEVAWTQKMQKRPYATFGSVIAAHVGNDAAIISASGNVVRASDGKQLFSETDLFGGECPSPVVRDGVWYNFDRQGAYAFKLPDTLDPGVKAAVVNRVDIGREYMVASPLYYDGLLYCLDMTGRLSVLDMVAGKIAYQQILPLNKGGGPAGASFMSSPTLAGKYIYIMDGQGGTLVMEPGRRYKQVAMNKIEALEIPSLDSEARQRVITAGNPWFDGSNIYVRGEDRLICIGVK